jgi:hypothetical protein
MSQAANTITISVADLRALCDRLEARAHSFLQTEQSTSQGRDLATAAALLRHFAAPFATAR